MIGVIVLLLVGVALFIAIVWLVRAWLFKREIVREFKRCNVIVAGKKGSGKDLLFQEVIHARKADYYGNIDYGGGFHRITCKDISVMPNTYRNFVEDDVMEIKRRFVERRDFYVSDGGVFLPSYMDSLLYKQFPSFPIFYALSRHISEANVHVNVQNFGRLWKALREQADSYVLVRRTIRVPFFLIIDATLYDRYQSAEAGLQPVKVRMFNKHSKAETDIYHAENGYIKHGFVIVPKAHIKYDTRAFEKVLYNVQPRILDDEAAAS